MTIISTPADARILLNGIEIAQSTPVEVELTEGQTYTVAAIRAGYLDQGFGFDFPGDLTVEMMSQHRIDFELEERPIPKNAGFLEIGGSGYPVVLTVGGEQHGPAPSLRVPVAPGEYEVTARSEQVSFERTWERLRVRPAEVEKLPLPATVTVQISTFPDNGQVSVDGRAIDEAPFTLTLVVGRHDFLVKWPGSERSRSLRKRVTRRTQKIHITAD